ncbi:MAG: YitT family protein [Muribaculaceae bacterium]|nr:YitT family protein [Muribaculaceae bacterium]
MQKVNKQQLWRTTRDYIFITLGMCIYALGFTAFILPEKVIIGGLAGIGSLVYFLTNIPVAITQYVANLILLAFAYRIVGRKFVIGTIYGATMISVFVGIFQPIFTTPMTSEPVMNIVIGGIMCGFGIGLTFIHNGSSGGTDIVAAMVSKKSNVSIGRTMLYTDVFIISSSYLLFHSIDKIVYGFVVLFLVSYMADLMINTNRQAVQFTIFSPHWREIATAINNEAHRGCTVLNGTGWYSKHEVKILLVMCRKIESVTIFRIIKSIDRDAFVTQANVNGVYGKGFDEVKVKMKLEPNGHDHRITTPDSESRPNLYDESKDTSPHPRSMM